MKTKVASKKRGKECVGTNNNGKGNGKNNGGKSSATTEGEQVLSPIQDAANRRTILDYMVESVVAMKGGANQIAGILEIENFLEEQESKAAMKPKKNQPAYIPVYLSPDNIVSLMSIFIPIRNAKAVRLTRVIGEAKLDDYFEKYASRGGVDWNLLGAIEALVTSVENYNLKEEYRALLLSRGFDTKFRTETIAGKEVQIQSTGSQCCPRLFEFVHSTNTSTATA